MWVRNRLTDKTPSIYICRWKYRYLSSHPVHYTMVSIDHHAYPHIVERILNNASGTALAAFRLASRHYNDKIIRMSSHHIRYDRDRKGYSGDGFVRSNNGALAVPPSSLHKYFKDAKILDIYWADMGDVDDTLAGHLEGVSLEVVRNYTHLDYREPTPYAKTTLCLGDTQLYDDTVYDKIVFYTHITCGAYSGCDRPPPLPAATCHLIIICPPEGLKMTTTELADRVAEILRNLDVAIGGDVTVVGMVASAPAGQTIEAVTQQMSRQMLDKLKVELQHDEGDEDVIWHGGMRVEERIKFRFVTRDEYTATLSEVEKFATLPDGRRGSWGIVGDDEDSEASDVDLW